MKLRSALDAALLCAVLLGAGSASAQTTVLRLDGSLPNGLTDDLAQLQPGPAYEVLESHGWLSGSNLFHSFDQLDVAPGESVAFKATTPNLGNVITRVTGGLASNIDGAIESQIPGADFYLLNPAGILFGPASDLDVPASLFLGTPTDLRFANGDVLDLVDPTNPVLSVAAPEAFGFDGGGALAEVVIASALGSPAIEVPAGESLTIVAGRFEAFGRRTLAADGGRIQIGAVGTSALDVPLADLGGVVLDPAAPLGEVVVRDQTTLSTTNTGDLTASQGTIVIRGGRFELASRGVLRAAGDPGTGLRAIDVAVTGEVDVRDQGRISVDNAESATGGIRVAGATIRVRDGGLVQTIVSGSDDGSGTQDLDGGTLLLVGDAIEVSGGQVLSSSQPISGNAGDGRGSDIVLDADRVAVDGGGLVGGFSFAAGDGGHVTVRATTVEVAGGEISTSASGAGAGGAVVLEADTGPVRIVDGGVVATRTSGGGLGGGISITAGSLEILDGSAAGTESAVEAGTTGAMDGGAIDVDVGTLRIGRSAGSDRAGRLATAVGMGASGSSGDVLVTADSVTLDGGGQISTTTLGTGNAGSIDIDATGDVALSGQDLADDGATPLPSGVFTRAGTGTLFSSADAGSVAIDAANVDVLDGAEISTRAIGTGASGDVALTATGRIRVVGTSGQSSAVTARALEGAGGDVILTSDVLEVEDGGRVDVSTDGGGTGGLLTVRTGDLLVRGESPSGTDATLTAQTGGLGDAQGIDIEATRSVRVETGGVVTAQATFGGTAGSPGDVSIRAPSIAVDGGRITTQAGSAAGGDIALEATSDVVIQGGAEVSARSSGGDSGSIRVVAPVVVVRDGQVVADADAFGGEVTLEGSEVVLLERARIEAASRGGGGPLGGIAGGNVFIRGGGVVLNQSTIAADGFGNANGGNVLLSGDVVLQSTDTQVTFSSQLGTAGTFAIDSPYTEVTGDLASLPENFLDASALLEEACLARDAPSGSFAVRRVGDLADPPDAALRDDDTNADDPSARCAP